MKHSSVALGIGLRKGIDQRIISPIFVGLFGIYLVPYDTCPLAEAEEEGNISRFQTHKSVTVCVVNKPS